jgi:hypothetical protein
MRQALLAAALLVVGCELSNPLLSSPEGREVDKFLKEHLDDPEYDVVKVWPAINSETAEQVVDSKGQRMYPQWKGAMTVRTIRVRYRAKATDGGLQSRDEIFFIDLLAQNAFCAAPDQFDAIVKEFSE